MKLIKQFLMVSLLGLAAFLSTRSALADCCLTFPAYPSNQLSIYITYQYYTDTLFDFTITNGTLIPPGTYGGWCIDANDSIDPSQNYTVPGTVYNGALYSTCDTNELQYIPNHGGNPPVGPPPVTPVSVWHELNYLINHRVTNDSWDVQVAINYLIGGPPVFNGDGNPADNAYPTINSNVVQSMINAAVSNAPSWHAQCGDKVAVVYVVTPPTNTTEQLVILEVPCCSVNFTLTPTNMDLGCNPTNIPVCQSPVNTNLVNAVSCCGRTVTITCSSSDSTVGCKTYRTFTYTATDGYGNNATTSYTVCWTVDNSAPVIISVPTGTNLGCNPVTLPGDSNILSQVIATNTCSAPTIHVSHLDSGTPCAMSRTFTITATDACNNTSLPKTVVYTWKIDTNAPVIVTVPGSTNLGCNPAILPGDTNIAAQVVASDNCGSVTVNVSHVDSGSPCAMQRTFSIYAKDGCGNLSATNKVVYSWKIETNAPVVNCPPNYYITNGVTSVSCYDQNGWSGKCNNNCLSTLNNCFNKVYTNGYLLCGLYGSSTRCFACTAPQCIQTLLPCVGTPCCLSNSYLNPTNCGSGSFAGHVLCLQLNVDFCDNSNTTGFKGCFGNLVLTNTSCPLAGKSVRQVLGLCQNTLGGCTPPSGCTVGQLNDICSNLNYSFCNSGVPSTWCCTNVGGIVTTNVPPSQSGYATATSSCGEAVTLTYSDVVTAGGCDGAYTIARTWKAVDGCGNVGTCTQYIYIGNPYASICGYVFLDCNGDGRLSAGIDMGISNVMVTLLNASNAAIATNFTDGTGAYCFYNLTAGTYSVAVALTNYTQTAGCHTNHWLDVSNNDCWFENDSYQHCKNTSGSECWTDNNGYQHCLNSAGQDCWKDHSGICHTQSCSYVGCNVPKGNKETITLTGCEALNCVNFAYQGSAAQCAVAVSGPGSGTCGKTSTYTCCVTNTGTVCFNSCTVSVCGGSYTCPSLQPGQGCQFQVNYCYKTTDCGTFNCQAVAACGYHGSSSYCSGKGSCNTSVGRY